MYNQAFFLVYGYVTVAVETVTKRNLASANNTDTRRQQMTYYGKTQQSSYRISVIK